MRTRPDATATPVRRPRAWWPLIAHGNCLAAAALLVPSTPAAPAPAVQQKIGSVSFPNPITQQAYLKASNTGSDDYFGTIALSGDTLVVGSNSENSRASGVNGDQNDENAYDAGAAYVFVRNGTTWSQQAYLKASNPGAFQSFGWSVATSGDTVVVGEIGAPSVGFSAGAVHVFVRSGTNWSQQASLKPSHLDPFDYFGWSVAISSDTIVVGAKEEASNATGVNGDQNNNSATAAGAAYVFVRTGTNWSQQAYLKASNTEALDVFGYSLALSGDTLVVGALYEDSGATGVNANQSDNSASEAGAAYVFVRSGTNWSQQAYLKASNTDATDRFGYSVAVSGNTVVVGAIGEASGAKGVNGDESDNTAQVAGAAYVFVRNGTNWSQQAYLKASNTQSNGPFLGDYFGASVAVSGNTVVVGAFAESSSAIGIDGDQNDNSARDAGAAYLFVRSGTIWRQQAYLKASNTEANDGFGSRVAMSGDTVVVSAGGEASNATGVNGNQSDNSARGSGAVYVFSPRGAATLTVTSTADSGPGSLRAALASAVDGDAINFALMTPATITLTSRVLRVTRNVTITGPGPAALAISGNHARRVFEIAPNTVVTISGLTITNANELDSSPQGGGGIHNRDATLTVSNCTFRGNSAVVGGGIFNAGNATLTVIHSTFGDNSSGLGGGIYNNYGKATVADSALTGNSAILGGGIYNNYGTVIVANSVLRTNSASDYGGGIYNDGRFGGGATLTLSNSTLNGNSAHDGGGGIYNTYGILTVADSTLSGNSALRLGGGGIFSGGGQGITALTLANSTISSNSALRGGGVANSATALILNSTISSNSASLGGGLDNGGRAHILNSTFNGNSAPSGSIFFSAGSASSLEIGSAILNASAASGNFSIGSGTMIVSLGYNLSSADDGRFLTNATDQINTDAMLGPLQDNGGPTFTHALLACSPAIDRGKNFSASATDQRGVGFARAFDDPAIPNGSGDGTDIGAFEAQAHVPLMPTPSITCPPNITVEFSSETGAVVTFSITTADFCDSNPVVVCVPPSGGVFPIGATTVQCTAQDADGNAASCSLTLTVLGARSVKENVLADLMTLRATVTDRHDGQKLDKAIMRLMKSLDSGLWIDETHLQRKHGEKVFQEERETVKKLCELIKDNRSSIPQALLQGFIDRIVRADRLLASVAIQDAIQAGGSPMKIKEAQAELAKGDSEVANGKCNEGIEHYKKAWDRATRATPSQSIRLADGHVQLEILGDPGQAYVIQASSNLTDWVTIATRTADDSGVITFEDADPGKFRLRYYRIVQP